MTPSIKAAVIATGMHFSTIGSALVRNVIFARLLSPEDFGVAMTFGVVLLLLEYMSNLGHESLLLRSVNGNKHGFQATLHFSLILRGVFVAAIIVLFAPAVSTFFRLPAETFNYAWLALVPLINGLVHLDYTRLQRDQNFLPNAKMTFWADGLSVIVALVLGLLLSSLWAFYISFVFRHSVSTVISHLVATRPYRIKVHAKYLREFLQFGAPLIVVGTIRFFAGEADKALVARVSGIEIFTIYILTLMLIANGSSLVSNAFAKIFIRRVSRETSSTGQRRAAETNGILVLYMLCPVLLFFGVFAELLINTIFGESYEPPRLLVPILIAVVMFRSLNLWLNQIIIASLSTNVLVISDLIRTIGLISAIGISTWTADVRMLAFAFIFGELGCYIYLTSHLNSFHQGFNRFSLQILAIAFIALAVIGASYDFLYAKDTWTKLLYVLVVTSTFVVAISNFSETCRTASIQVIKYIKTYARINGR